MTGDIRFFMDGGRSRGRSPELSKGNAKECTILEPGVRECGGSLCPRRVEGNSEGYGDRNFAGWVGDWGLFSPWQQPQQ